jgi:hypothetical protein
MQVQKHSAFLIERCLGPQAAVVPQEDESPKWLRSALVLKRSEVPPIHLCLPAYYCTIRQGDCSEG